MIYIGIQNDPGMKHHGILGQRWGVRRFQNPDGTLTEAGKLRYQNDDGSLKPNAEKYIRKTMWNAGSWSNRNNLADKMKKELDESPEGKNYNDLLNRRQVVVRDGKGNIVSKNLSYMNDDWSDPKKVVDEMVKDMNVQYAYKQKDIEITNKYLREFSGALLKDLGFKDTEKGREFLIANGILSEYNEKV